MSSRAEPSSSAPEASAMTDSPNPAIAKAAATSPAWFQPRRTVRAPKASEFVARDLAAFIIERQLPDGTRLPIEREMLETLKVGRNTLREALRLLETRGVITVRPGRTGGPVVRRPRTHDLSEALVLLLAFESASLSDVLHARQAVEPMVARLAAKRITAEQLAAMRDTIDVMTHKAGDQVVFLEQNMLFHSLIAEASGNVVLRIVNETLKSISDGAAFGVQYSALRHRQVASVHTRILLALQKHDGDAAEAEMRAHLSDTGRYWQAKYGTLFNKPVRWHDYHKPEAARQ